MSGPARGVTTRSRTKGRQALTGVAAAFWGDFARVLSAASLAETMCMAEGNGPGADHDQSLSRPSSEARLSKQPPALIQDAAPPTAKSICVRRGARRRRQERSRCAVRNHRDLRDATGKWQREYLAMEQTIKGTLCFGICGPRWTTVTSNAVPDFFGVLIDPKAYGRA